MAGTSRSLAGDAFVSFALFGAYWGTWGASVPRIQRQAGLDDGDLGVALLFVGGGALLAMLVVGRAIDRLGLRVAAVVLPILGGAGAVMSLTALDLVTLSAGLALVGATSGASDVAINAVAGHAEARAGGAVITRAHAIFSCSVVVGSLATGACAAASLPASVPFLAVAAGGVTAGLRLARTLPRRTDGTPRPAETRPSEARDGTFGPGRPGIVALALIGVLGALAFASENAHQSWSAVFAHDVLHAGNGLAAGAPALFAAVVALARFAVGRVPFRYGRRVLLIGAVGATLGAVGIAAAPNLLLAAVGLTVAAAGTAVLFPTLLSAVARDVDDAYRGRATSAVTFVSYLGFLLGPVYVGAFADLSGLRAAMLAIAALGAALFVLTPVLLRPGAPASRPADRPRSARAGG